MTNSINNVIVAINKWPASMVNHYLESFLKVVEARVAITEMETTLPLSAASQNIPIESLYHNKLKK
jgi:hypothetical protein